MQANEIFKDYLRKRVILRKGVLCEILTQSVLANPNANCSRPYSKSRQRLKLNIESLKFGHLPVSIFFYFCLPILPSGFAPTTF